VLRAPDRPPAWGSAPAPDAPRAKRTAGACNAPRSPWQNAYVERVIGSIRRECLDHVVIFNERHLRHVLSSYVDYYHRARTHLSLDKDSPHSHPIQPPRSGRVIAIPQVGGCTITTSASRPDGTNASVYHGWSPLASVPVPIFVGREFSAGTPFVRQIFGRTEVNPREAAVLSGSSAGRSSSSGAIAGK
jgi:hypothetical protein